jgi:hypothetical protein
VLTAAVAAVLAGGLAGLAAPPAAAGSVAAARGAPPAGPSAIPAGGTGTATAHPVNMADLAGSPAVVGPAHATLGVDGKPTGSTLADGKPTGRKPAPAAPPAGGPNHGRGVTPLTAPPIVNLNVDGLDQAAGGGAQPPDVNAAAGPTQIVEIINRRFAVYNKANGAQLCTATLNAFLLGTAENVFDPRVQYDNVNDRFSMVASLSPAAGAVPAMYVAASQTGNACGGWWVYRPTFFGGLYPNGTLLDYPQLGQDRVALLISSNNFNPGYINSAAFSIPKSAVYSGAGFSFTSFGVSFTAEPITVGGNPMPATVNSYFLAAVPGTGYNLYRMTNSAGPGTTLVLQATIASAFAPPPRRVNQPGTATTLDPLDGRIVWSPFLLGNFLWFTHGINIGGFPGVRYGAISVSTNTATVAVAFRSGTSDDFNPSIGVSDAGGGLNRVWLNWAYTDTPAGVATSVTVDGVLPGAGVPSLVGTGLVLVNGSPTATNTRFGDYSSVSVENACTATVAQQYFGPGGGWRTRLGRLSFC